ncbi:HNH endonuclease signature motif containing protein, partial [Arthrobacter ginkgonis]
IPGEGHRAAELNGHGPIDDASARRLAAQTATWTRLYATPGSLAVVGMDHHRYRPTPAQRRALWAADQTCRFPGCRRNALACEPDHVHEHHHGGPTELGNLASLCRKHHTYKSLGLWTTRIGADRTLEFTSPAGRTYRTDPPLPWHTDPPDPPQDTQPHDAPSTPFPGQAKVTSHASDAGGPRSIGDTANGRETVGKRGTRTAAPADGGSRCPLPGSGADTRTSRPTRHYGWDTPATADPDDEAPPF